MPKKQNVKFHPGLAVSAAAMREAIMTASYIADLAGELEKLADQKGIGELADALRAARVEALRVSALRAA